MQEVKKIQEAYFGKLSSKTFGPMSQTAFDPRTWLKENLFEVYPSSAFTTSAYIVSITTILLFSLFGFTMARRAVSQGAFKTNKTYLSARRSQNFFRIGWSLFATALGAWAMAAPASFAATHGYLGLVGFCIATSLPIFILPRLGELLQSQLHDPFSLTHFIRSRFGLISQIFAILLCSLSTIVALLAEYMVLGSVFQTFLKSTPLPITLAIGFLTLIYTSYGGLTVSILTDQIQGILSFLIVLITTVYVGINFRPSFPSFPDHLGATSQGAWSILTLPLSFLSYTLFSESMWQRIWAGRNPLEVRKGAFFSSILVFLVTFLISIMGFLASWAYHVDPTAPAHHNILLFRILGKEQYHWVGILFIFLITLLAQSNIDSQQNALTSILASFDLLTNHSPTSARSIVTLLNIPLVLIGSFYPKEVMQLFLTVNLLSTCAAVPLMVGMVTKWNSYVNGSTFLLGSLSGILALSSYGIIHTGSILDGLVWAWWSNDYEAVAFFTAFFGSLAGVITSFFSNIGSGIIPKLSPS